MLTTDDVVGAVDQVRRNKGLPAVAVALDARLVDLGLASLDLAEVLVILEDCVGAELDPYRNGPVVTVGDLARLAPYGRTGEPP